MKSAQKNFIDNIPPHREVLSGAKQPLFRDDGFVGCEVSAF